MLNYKLNAQGGFTPAVCGSPDVINPEKVLRHHRSTQGQEGGTGSCPFLHSYQHPEFHIHGKGIFQSPSINSYHAPVGFCKASTPAAVATPIVRKT